MKCEINQSTNKPKTYETKRYFTNQFGNVCIITKCVWHEFVLVRPFKPKFHFLLKPSNAIKFNRKS